MRSDAVSFGVQRPITIKPLPASEGVIKPLMIRSFLTVSTGTLASRLLGFARDSMIAALLGAGPVADAFLVAFQLVNVIRRLLTEGALNAALVPAWLRIRDAEGPVAAAAFAGRILATVSAALIAAAALIGILMPIVITALAPGFTGHPALQLAIEDARLMLPYLAFAGPVTVMMTLMNAQHRFALTAFSPLLFNLSLIGVMIALLGFRQDPATAARVIAVTVGAAGLLQLAILLLRRGSNAPSPLRISLDAQMRGFLATAIPGMVASCGPQLLVIAGAVIASTSPSAISWLYFANRLIELPLGIVGVAMGTVLVPELTRALRGEDQPALAHAQSRALELAVGLALPAMLGLIVLSEPIVRMLFQHGAFGASDSAATARILMWLALGLPAHVLVKALSPAFFARQDTFTPLLATLKGLAVAIVLAIVLNQISGPSAIAAGIACGAWSSALVLIRRGAATFGFSIDAAARRRLPRILLAAMAMGGLLWAPTRWAPAGQTHALANAAVLMMLMAGAAVIYGLLLALLGVIGRDEALIALRQNVRSDLRDQGPRGM
jgi:putative peptidoglycan lipid II flippase